MQTYYVIPTIGEFKVTIETVYDIYDKGKVRYYTLNMGGDSTQDKCVYLTIHPEDSSNNKEIMLSWTEAAGKQCTVDKQTIKGSKTIEMLQLAFTIAREIAPHAEYISLSDMSYFNCNTPEGSVKMSLPPFHIAFHDKTWYEDKFGAEMINADIYKKYREHVQNMYKEKFMPPFFDFGNTELTSMLSPLYEEAKTWKQFFTLIESKYHNRKCVLMYPWLTRAMGMIFEKSHVYIGENWKIDLNKIPKIHYYQLDRAHITGGQTQRKYLSQAYNYHGVNYGNTMNWNLNAFLKRRTTNKQKKKRANKTIKNRPLVWF